MRRQQARCLVAAVDRRRLFFVVAAAARALVVSALPTRSSSVPPTAPSSSSLSLVVPRVPAPPRIARVCLSLGCCYYASPIPKERLCLLLSPVETTTTTVRRRLLFCPCLDLASMISRRLSGRRRKRKTYFSTRSRQSSSVLIIRCCFNNVVRVRSDDDTMNKVNHQRDDDKIVCTQNTVRALHSRERSARKKEGSLFYTRTNDGGLTPSAGKQREKNLGIDRRSRTLARKKRRRVPLYSSSFSRPRTYAL